MYKRKDSTISIIWTSSSASNSKWSLVIIINGFYYRSFTCQWKGFVVVDQLTKMAHFIPCTKIIKEEETAILFFDNIYCIHGLPNDIDLDMGT